MFSSSARQSKQNLTHTCEAKIPFIDKLTGRKIYKWIERAAAEIIAPHPIRCKECHGPVRLHKSRVGHGPAEHVEHIAGHPSVENCRLGARFIGLHSMSKIEVA